MVCILCFISFNYWYMAFDILEIIVDGKKYKSSDITIKWREWDGAIESGSIEKYASNYASFEVGVSEAGEGW